jgi:hypothetical protein
MDTEKHGFDCAQGIEWKWGGEPGFLERPYKSRNMGETNGLPDRVRSVPEVVVETRAGIAEVFANFGGGLTSARETCEIGLIQEPDEVLDGR